MIILYSSNTGYTRQYAELLQKELDVPTYSIDHAPSYLKGNDAIFLGWLMAGNVMGLGKAKNRFNLKCVVATGMSPESEEQEMSLHEKNGLAPGIPLFYLQGGYDFSKLKGIYKLMMSLKSKEILSRFDGKSEEEKRADATYRMITQGYSVVAPERLARVVSWARSNCT